jgi:decaprenyl-phosphate phosphoribosyltransferase
VLETLKSSLKALRLKQWAKNLLLVVAPLSAGINTVHDFAIVFLAILGFSLTASAGYVINDLFDINYDKQHPVKSKRPFASGALNNKNAAVILISLFLTLLLLLRYLPRDFGYLLLLYFALTYFYTRHLKNIPVFELFLVASGFVLRLIAGAICVDLRISEWFLIVGGAGALLIAASKRLSELTYSSPDIARKVIQKYSREFLTLVISSSLSICMVAYSLWAFSQTNDPIWYQLSIIPFSIALFRYLFIGAQEGADSPEEIILSDKVLLTLLLVNSLTLLLGIY